MTSLTLQTCLQPSRPDTPAFKHAHPRIEYKYQLPIVFHSSFVNDLTAACDSDPHSQENQDGYLISSIYYDSPTLKCYHDKLEGLADRFKLRVRFYGTDRADRGKVEFKYKAGEQIRKTTLSVAHAQIISLTAGHPPAIGSTTDPHLLNVYRQITLNRFRPVLRLEYRRSAWYVRTDPHVRITIDSDVRAGRVSPTLDDHALVPVFDPTMRILEIKTPGYFPFWLARLITKYDLQRQAISKYASGLNRLAHNGIPI